jgi:glycosyltransferase involved in cell wall biosynthesis
MKSLAQQSVGKRAFRVLIVDNASDPPLPDSILELLRNVGVKVKLVQEPSLGVYRARLRAASETSSDWVLFVDDDNELSPNYIAEGLTFIQQHPEVGCFGGKLLLAQNLNPPRWVLPFLPYLGIKDVGDKTLIGISDKWEKWEPPTAGAFVCRRLLDYCLKQSTGGSEMFRLGRQGQNLFSCEDSLVMRNALRLNLSNAYYPKLMLHHHLDPRRFGFWYLMRLMHAYGYSQVILESILKGRQSVPNYYASMGAFIITLLWVFGAERKKSLAFVIGQIAYHLGARREHLKQGRSQLT